MEERERPTNEQKDAWHTDPKNWKWGIFYYNPEDKRLFPPKKIKYLGWTVNFANPYSIFAMLILIGIILILISFLRSILNNL